MKVADESGTIAEVQADALRAIGALADKVRKNVEDRARLRRLARTAKGIESEIGAWLAALARCLQLKDEHEILEFDHFLRTAPDAFKRHRIALARASQERGERIAAAVRTLTTQMTEADGVAEAHVLLHTSGSRNVIDSVKMPLREAIRDPRQLKSAGVELVRGAGKCAAVAGAFAAVGVLLARPRRSGPLGGARLTALQSSLIRRLGCVAGSPLFAAPSPRSVLRTDLGAELDRSRCGSGPISAWAGGALVWTRTSRPGKKTAHAGYVEYARHVGSVGSPRRES